MRGSFNTWAANPQRGGTEFVSQEDNLACLKKFIWCRAPRIKDIKEAVSVASINPRIFESTPLPSSSLDNPKTRQVLILSTAAPNQTQNSFVLLLKIFRAFDFIWFCCVREAFSFECSPYQNKKPTTPRNDSNGIRSCIIHTRIHSHSHNLMFVQLQRFHHQQPNQSVTINAFLSGGTCGYRL